MGPILNAVHVSLSKSKLTLFEMIRNVASLVSLLITSIRKDTSFVVNGLATHCPNNCNNRGVCSQGSLSVCDCFPGFHGVDCSLRTCPSSKAWVDFPSQNDTAHGDFTECSNMVQT